MSGRPCLVRGLVAVDGSRWDEDCNTCRCHNGRISCTKVPETVLLVFPVLFLGLDSESINHETNFSLRQLHCGPPACSLHGNTGTSQCPTGQTCVPVQDTRCFTKPCSGQGECWSPARRAPPTARCHLDRGCANVTFTFNKDAMAKASMAAVVRC